MEKKELLASLNALTDRYAQHRNYIEKARGQASTGKFNTAVIEKVILDHEIKSSDVADQVAPILPRLRELLAALEADKAAIEAGRGTVDEQLQELELRAMIGELTDGEFEQMSGDLRANQASANERIAAIDADWQALDGGIQRWAEIAGPAGHYSAPAAAAAAQPEPAAPVAEPEPEPETEPEPVIEEAEPVAVEASISAEVEEVGGHVTRAELREDLSLVFPPPAADTAQVRVSGFEDDIAIETAEPGEVGEDVGDAPSTDVPFGFEEDILGNDAPVVSGEVEIDLAGGEPAVAVAPVSPTSDASEAPRRALLLYQEGTAEEQIYPFTGETLTIGRGRENDIQIKNDSKVSRYHCKLFRRGNNFYIEDQKSSNGSLVNGELITDRRLFGGEEIIIGETFFRFRIME